MIIKTEKDINIYKQNKRIWAAWNFVHFTQLTYKEAWKYRNVMIKIINYINLYLYGNIADKYCKSFNKWP